MAEREIQETEIQVGGSPQGQAQPTTSKAVEGQTCINGAIQEKSPRRLPQVCEEGRRQRLGKLTIFGMVKYMPQFFNSIVCKSSFRQSLYRGCLSL